MKREELPFVPSSPSSPLVVPLPRSPLSVHCRRSPLSLLSAADVEEERTEGRPLWQSVSVNAVLYENWMFK